MRNYAAKTVIDPSEFKTNPGSPIRPIYRMKIDKEGHRYLDEVDKMDIQASINSYRESTDIAFMIKRLSNGDTSVLNPGAPAYGDFTKFPKTYAEMYNMVSQTEDAFLKMPADIRKQFNNDLGEWFASVGTEEWLKKMDPLLHPAPAAASAAVSQASSESVSDT